MVWKVGNWIERRVGLCVCRRSVVVVVKGGDEG